MALHCPLSTVFLFIRSFVISNLVYILEYPEFIYESTNLSAVISSISSSGYSMSLRSLPTSRAIRTTRQRGYQGVEAFEIGDLSFWSVCTTMPLIILVSL